MESGESVHRGSTKRGRRRKEREINPTAEVGERECRAEGRGRRLYWGIE